MTFGEKLRKLREERGILQKDLADYLECSSKTISGYEAGGKQPSYSLLVKIAEFFGVTTDSLVSDNSGTLSDLEESFPEGVQVLRRADKELSPEAKAKMIKLMKAFLEEE